MAKLKDIAKNLKVGDVFWMEIKVYELGNQNVSLEERHFGIEGCHPVSSMLGSDTYGDTKVFLGDINEDGTTTKIVKEGDVKVEDRESLGMVEAYEKILFNKKNND